MKKTVLFLFLFCSFVFAAAEIGQNNPLYGIPLITSIPEYDRFGSLFVILQSKLFWAGFLFVVIALPLGFALHYKLIGAKVFSHSDKKIYVFNLFARTFHWIAALSFIILVPTGLIMVFGDFFGGGTFVRACKNLHGIATIIFAISVLPITFSWIKDMLLSKDDIKWFAMMGGYLSKAKREVPSGKFNGGQKMWFWIAIPGGLLMIATGACMFFLNSDLTLVSNIFGIKQIELLRISAIVHNVLGILIVAMFFVHVYMSVFAIKGSLHSMIGGYKEEEEVALMHSSWYKKLKAKGKI
ncbi:MAG: formate dehydrogenase subunit gamma [Campylobacteraceae bacterium]|jgi:formate dehydrogenase subunit gamma|nr:formate dehydrogenase subunit gamma [Campylobacteraceae bacterium]